MIYCPHCEKIISSDAKFCSKCGKLVTPMLTEAVDHQVNVQKKFYEKVEFAWLMLFLALPVGVFFLWKYKHYTLRSKIISLVAAALTLVAVVWCMGYVEQYQQQSAFNKWYARTLSICDEVDGTHRLAKGAFREMLAGELASNTTRIRLQNALVTMNRLEGSLLELEPPQNLSSGNREHLKSVSSNLAAAVMHYKRAYTSLNNTIERGYHTQNGAEFVKEELRKADQSIETASAFIYLVKLDLDLVK